MTPNQEITEAILKSIQKADSNVLIPLLSETIYTAKDIGLTSRNSNHWRNKGLLFQTSDEKIAKTTAKFSLSEVIWIRAMQYMRSFGLPIADLLNIKTQIFEELSLKSIDNNKKLWIEKLKDELIKTGASNRDVELFINKVESDGLESLFKNYSLSYNPFVFLIVEALLNRNECGILITNRAKKEVIIWIDGVQETNPEYKNLLRMTHIYISFKQIFNELVLEGLLINENLIDENELQIIKALKIGNLKEVLVTAKKGKPYSMKITRKEDEYNVAKLILKYPKGNINLMRNGNKIVGAEIVESRTIQK